jgi:hypothetical protein
MKRWLGPFTRLPAWFWLLIGAGLALSRITHFLDMKASIKPAAAKAEIKQTP